MEEIRDKFTVEVLLRMGQTERDGRVVIVEWYDRIKKGLVSSGRSIRYRNNTSEIQKEVTLYLRCSCS